MMDRAIRLSPYSPRWYHIIPFMNHYMNEEYALALSEALQINAPTCLWDPLLRAAIYGQLGRSNEAEIAYAELLQIQPDFVERQKRLLQGLFLSDSMLKKTLRGLRAARLLPI
jgi:tetratricopeptide (TPR) repeat protein